MRDERAGPLVGTQRAHIELYIRQLGARGLMDSSANTMMHAFSSDQHDEDHLVVIADRPLLWSPVRSNWATRRVQAPRATPAHRRARVVGATGHDGTMLITPRLGADRTTVLQQLVQLETDLANVRSGGMTAEDLFNAYLRWTANAVRLLRHQTREADIESLVLTRRYWTLQAMAGGPVGMVRDLVEVEIDDRQSVFSEAIRTTRFEFERWDRLGPIVVADTSFYHEHPQKIDQADLSKVLESRHAAIGLVVPMVVIDELEKQKRSSDKNLRGRAQVTLAVFERVARHGGAGRLREADFSPIDQGGIPSGEIWLDVLFDLPGHTRLPINDDEIVDRALSVQTVSGKGVTFLTYDTNQALRARHAGLKNVMHLRHERSAQPN